MVVVGAPRFGLQVLGCDELAGDIQLGQGGDGADDAGARGYVVELGDVRRGYRGDVGGCRASVVGWW